MVLLRDLSFRYKTPLRGSVLVILTAALVTASLMFREYDELRQDLLQNSASMGRVLARTLVAPMVHDDVWRAYEIINTPFHAGPQENTAQSAEVVIVLDATQQIYVSTHPSQYPMLTDPSRVNPEYAVLQQTLSGYSGLEPSAVEIPGSNNIYVVTPIVSDSAGIAHEINNPLGGMLNAINTFKRHGSADPVTAKTISLLERGLLQIKDTIAALLIEAEGESHPLTRQDIEDTHTLVQPDAHKKSARFVWENDILETLPLPSTLVRQILINLLLNAIQAIEEKGHVYCHVYRNSDTLFILVKNGGQHIPPEQMEYLFEPFSPHRESGHGLGLWVTYQIVNQMRGDITVKSEPGETCFTVQLPFENQT